MLHAVLGAEVELLLIALVSNCLANNETPKTKRLVIYRPKKTRYCSETAYTIMYRIFQGMSLLTSLDLLVSLHMAKLNITTTVHKVWQTLVTRFGILKLMNSVERMLRKC